MSVNKGYVMLCYVIVVLVTCKNEGDTIKNKGASVFTTLYIDFSDAQGQVIP